MVANVQLGLVETLVRKVLAEHSPGKFHLRQLMLPVLVVFGWIGIDCFARAAMNRKIGLPVTVEVKGSEYHTIRYRLFEDSCRNRLAVAHGEPRQPNVDLDELHVSPQIDPFSRP